MRLTAVFVSSAFVLAGMSAALSIEREDMLVARFADSDAFDEFDARAYDEESDLYARGAAMSRITGAADRERSGNRPPSYRAAQGDRPPAYRPSQNHPPPLPDFRRETDYSNNHKSPSATSRHRRAYYAPYDKLAARGNVHSKGGSGSGDKERKDGRPPKYKNAKNDPPPRYEPSEHHPPPLPEFRTETDYSRNHKSPSGTSRHRRSFYDLD